MFVIPSRLQQVQVLLTSEWSNYDSVPGFSVLDIQKLEIKENAPDPIISDLEEEGLDIADDENAEDVAISDCNGVEATRDKIINDILSFAETSLIKDCLVTNKCRVSASPPVPNNIPSTKNFLLAVFFEFDLDLKLREFDEFCENQIGLESLLDDVVQSSMDASTIDGVDCF